MSAATLHVANGSSQDQHGSRGSSGQNHGRKNHVYVSMKHTVILSAISAAFAATTTLLMCFLLSGKSDRSYALGSYNIQSTAATTDFDAADIHSAESELPTVSEDPNSVDLDLAGVEFDEQDYSWLDQRALPAADAEENMDGDNFNPSHGLDFAIIGWPKTGTSFLLKTLGDHPEIKMPEKEFCDVVKEGGDEILTDWLQSEVSLQSSSPLSVPRKYGIKCPSMIKNMQSIENLKQMSASTRLVIGVRHPVLWFESFYNYRVKNVYGQNLSPSSIQSPLNLTGTKQWCDVSTAYAQYELFLKQLGKVSLSMKESLEMVRSSKDPHWEKSVAVNPYKVFMYTPEQLSDKNATRQDQFRNDLQQFLRLEAPIQNFDDTHKVNSNKLTYPEYIDICDPTYARIKHNLLRAGKKSSEWILEKFLKSSDVVVSDMEFFTENLKAWSVDPCKERNRNSNTKLENNEDVNRVSVRKGRKTAQKEERPV